MGVNDSKTLNLVAYAWIAVALIMTGWFLATSWWAAMVLMFYGIAMAGVFMNASDIAEIQEQQKATTEALARMVRARRRRK